jgi:hypothetical protein
MLPGVDGFSWSTGNLIFLGAFFSVAAVIGVTVSFAVLRVIRDFRSQKTEKIRWEADFEDLPHNARACRHELTGEVKHRTCENGFECGHCGTHPVFLKAAAAAAKPHAEVQDVPSLGLDMPADRMYHRGHTWVREEADGRLAVGIDDFAARLLGSTDVLELPSEGTRLHGNGTACVIRKGSAAIRVLSPVDGEVVETGGLAAGFLFRLRRVEETDTRHLLSGSEVRPWILREIERLQFALSPEGVGLSLADGGEIVRDLPAACPSADWRAVWGDLFLEP